MRSNIETIKFTGLFCLALAVLTYIVTLNIEMGFFQPNWIWMSNNFALTVCGGAFASFLVVMLCEMQKYRSNKLSCENFLYNQAMYLYSVLYFLDRNIDEYIADQNEPVPNNLVDEKIMMIRSQSMAIRSVDYTTFRKNNALVTAHQDFCANGLAKADSIIGSGNYLKMAIIQTQIKNLEATYCKGTVTSADMLVAQTLVALKNHISPVLSAVSTYLGTINQYCSGRYNWEEEKTKIHDGYISLFEAGKFEDFLKEAEVKQ